MKNKIWVWVFLFISIITIAFVSWHKFEKTSASAEILSKKQAQKLIQERYQGIVTDIKFVDQQYHLVLEKQKIVYKIRLDAVGGKVLSFIESGRSPTLPDTTSGSPSAINASPKIITETEAQKIAENHVKGSSDEIWIEVHGDVTYYLVEVDTKEDKEAIVQIHSITGNILSVTWDDHQKEDDDD